MLLHGLEYIETTFLVDQPGEETRVSEWWTIAFPPRNPTVGAEGMDTTLEVPNLTADLDASTKLASTSKPSMMSIASLKTYLQPPGVSMDALTPGGMHLDLLVLDFVGLVILELLKFGMM